MWCDIKILSNYKHVYYARQITPPANNEPDEQTTNQYVVRCIILILRDHWLSNFTTTTYISSSWIIHMFWCTCIWGDL